VIGRYITVDSRPRQIVGVMPEVILSAPESRSFPPMADRRNQVHLGNLGVPGIARLRPGVSLAEADADVARMPFGQNIHAARL
jgi:hypothetical protein